MSTREKDEPSLYPIKDKTQNYKSNECSLKLGTKRLETFCSEQKIVRLKTSISEKLHSFLTKENSYQRKSFLKDKVYMNKYDSTAFYTKTRS